MRSNRAGAERFPMASGAPGTDHRTSLPENAMIDVERARADTPAVEDFVVAGTEDLR